MHHLVQHVVPSWLAFCVLLLGLLGIEVLPHDMSTHRPAPEPADSSRKSMRANRVLQRSPGEPILTWSEEEPVIDGGRSYSVIVVESSHHVSNLFRDKERVRAYSSEGGQVVRSVKFASAVPPAGSGDSGPPFAVAHPEGVDKRVRIVYIPSAAGPLSAQQVSHLRAACEDESETTVVVIADETCRWTLLGRNVPPACSNVVRIYPFNDIRRGEEEHHRIAYIPLGPRDTFPFIVPQRRRLASLRPLLFTLNFPRSDLQRKTSCAKHVLHRLFFGAFKPVVTVRDSERRANLVALVERYIGMNPEVKCSPPSKFVSPTQWQDQLLDSRFTVSPAGHNAETFRTWEALEAGSIPIVSQTDFTDPEYHHPPGVSCGEGSVGWNVVASSPFVKEVSVDDWDELPELLHRLSKEPEDYINKLQEDCMKWYSEIMEQTYRSMLNFGEGHELFPQDGPLVYASEHDP